MWLLVNNIHANFHLHFYFFTFHRVQMTTSTKIGQNFDRSILMDKNAGVRNLFIENEAFCLFAFLTLRVFPLPPWKEIQLLTRFLCCLWCFVYLSFGWGKRRNFVFIGDNFFKTFYTGFHSRVTEKTKTFLTLVTYYLSGVASQVSLSYCIFFVSFIGGHNYLSYYLI